MATRSRTLQVVISGDARGLSNAFGQVEKGAGQAETRMHGFGAKVSSAFKLAGEAIAGAEIAHQLKETITAAEGAQVAQAKMATQLKAVGVTYKAHAAQITDVIEKTSDLSGITGHDLQDSFTNIVRSTGKLSQSLKLVGLAADIARAKHIDVAKAGQLVGKVAAGNTSALSRYGITIQKGATATQALGELQKRFGGQAEAYGKTAAGAQDRFRNAVEKLRESIGAKLLPIITKVASSVANLVAWTGKHTTATKAAVAAVAALVAGFAAFSVISKVVAIVKGLRAAWVALDAAMAANPIGAVVVAIAALGAGLVIAYKKSQTFRDIVNGAFNGVKKGVSAAIDFIVGAAKSGFALFKTLAHDGLLGPIPLILARWGQVKDFFKGLPGGIASAFGSVVGALRGPINDIIGVVNTAISAYNLLPGKDIGKIPKLSAPDSRPSTGAVKVARHATGGIVAGTGQGDTVPALLEPGEFVIRRRVVDQVGAGFLSQLNQGGTSTGGRYASGGPVAHAAGGRYTAAQLAALWVRAGGRPGAADMAAAIALAESSGDPNAGRDHPYHGLWQIGPGGPWDPLANAKEAVRKSYNGTNWNAWTTYTGYDTPGHAKTYKQFLGQSGYGTGSKLTAAVAKAVSKAKAARPAATLGAVLTRAPAHTVGHQAATGDAGFTQTNEPGTPTQGQQDLQREFQIGVRLQEINRLLGLKSTGAASRAQLVAEKGRLGGELEGILHPAAADTGTADTGTGADPNQPLIDAQNAAAEAAKAQTDALNAVRDELKRQNDNTANVNAVTSIQAVRALADVISGQIAGVGYAGRAMTAGSGSIARY